MINHIWSVLCRESIIDIDSNTISLINVVEELIVDLKPDVKLPMGEKLNINVNYEVVSMWSRDSFDDRAIGLKIELINPDKSVVNEFTHKAVFPEKTIRLRTRIKVQGLTVTVAGVYYIQVLYRHSDSEKFKTVARLQ